MSTQPQEAAEQKSTSQNRPDEQADLLHKSAESSLGVIGNAEADDLRRTVRRDRRLAIISSVVSVLALGVAAITAVITRESHTDATLLDALQSQYESFLSLSDLQIENSQLVHLAALPENYGRIAEQVSNATSDRTSEELGRLKLKERAFAFYIFSQYEHALYQYDHAQTVGNASREEFFSEVLSYFTGRLLRNPRLLSLWDPMQDGLSNHYEETTKTHYSRNVLQDKHNPLLVPADAVGPFSYLRDTNAQSDPPP